jgi:hypothetical protein
LPQNEVNHRSTMALFNVSVSMISRPHLVRLPVLPSKTEGPTTTKVQRASSGRTPLLALASSQTSRWVVAALLRA